jgi:hypothetical protein
MLHRRSLDKSSDNDQSLETLKDVASARKGASSPMPHHKQPALVNEEDEYATDVKEYIESKTLNKKMNMSKPEVARTFNRRAKA